MRHSQIARFASVVLFGGLTSAAGQVPAVDHTAEPDSHPVATASAVDVNRLPISMSRLQRRLRASTEREASEGLNLRYYVDVFGVAPPLVFFTKEDNLTTKAAPYGAPTHDEMIAVMTPRGLAPPPRGRLTRRSRK